MKNKHKARRSSEPSEVANQSDQELIAAILESPNDAEARLRYAALLESHHDRRADYVRAEIEWATKRSKKTVAKVRDLTVGVDKVWAARISRPPIGICRDWGRRCCARLSLDTGAVSANELDEIESEFGITLPADYRAYLLNYNGGWPCPSDFRIPGTKYAYGCSEELRCFFSVNDDSDEDPFFEVRSNLDEMKELRRQHHQWSREPHRNLMLVGVHGPMTYFEPEWVCLGCKGKVFGSVFIVKQDLRVCDRDYDLLYIAPSFSEFLGMLGDYAPAHIQAIRQGDLRSLRRWLKARGDANEIYRAKNLVTHAFLSPNNAIVREKLVQELVGFGATNPGWTFID